MTKLRLVADNPRSYEWESYPRREPKPPRERLGPIRRSGKEKVPKWEDRDQVVLRQPNRVRLAQTKPPRH
jgi:hypothetical protein